mmetsp:Transcript_43822/g.78827  ORF Transcript_43822/g.78827 Transcript_43822/m.78827 type:complete len:267 (+) Transcript_43822:413-1213(+)
MGGLDEGRLGDQLGGDTREPHALGVPARGDEVVRVDGVGGDPRPGLLVPRRKLWVSPRDGRPPFPFGPLKQGKGHGLGRPEGLVPVLVASGHDQRRDVGAGVGTLTLGCLGSNGCSLLRRSHPCGGDGFGEGGEGNALFEDEHRLSVFGCRAVGHSMALGAEALPEEGASDLRNGVTRDGDKGLQTGLVGELERPDEGTGGLRLEGDLSSGHLKDDALPEDEEVLVRAETEVRMLPRDLLGDELDAGVELGKGPPEGGREGLVGAS